LPDAGVVSAELWTTDPGVPSGFAVGEPATWYEIHPSTATLSGPATVCVPFGSGPAGWTPVLLHYGLGGWEELLPASVTYNPNIVCGPTTSFSPFVAAFKEPTYAFTGFSQPVDNAPTFNKMKAGAAVPVKFSLGGDFGLAIFADGYPSSVGVGCAGSAAVDAVEQTVASDSSKLTYDAASGQYSYIWKTNKLWAGTCRQLTLTLGDGTTKVANFQFTK
jgi:hypothetical protein